ncbi:MAG: ribosome recycling factor, partial [Acidobacteria bacterium]|nr:ribosome recycling factor [Acidobacteriota bacterium]
MTKEITTEARTRMERVLEDFKQKLSSVRTGRASTSILDPLQVEYYGTLMPLSQVATVHAPDASMLTIQPFD